MKKLEALAMVGVVLLSGCTVQERDEESGTTVQAAHVAPPRRVAIILFDQMIAAYADDYNMPN